MDVVAVLTKVVQEQQKTVQEQRLIIAELTKIGCGRKRDKDKINFEKHLFSLAFFQSQISRLDSYTFNVRDYLSEC